MSRSGYTDDDDDNIAGLYRANVTRTIRGRTGQAFLRELGAALDAMPVKALIAGDLVTEDGAVCAIGSVCQARGLNVSGVDVYDSREVAKAVGISRILAAEIEYVNDECGPWREDETPEDRWKRIRKWVDENLLTTA